MSQLIQIKIQGDGMGSSAWADRNPDKCPICNFSITPIPWGAAKETKVKDTPTIERVFLCPNQECERLFIARYAFTKRPNEVSYDLSTCVPVSLITQSQSKTIKQISPDFCAIYKQSDEAEQYGLVLVAGPGYRKALEFLIKDYIKTRLPETDASALAKKKELVEKTQLAKCIADFIDNKQIKDISTRATWLGNDETHYVRKWEDKDLKDLKKLILLVIHWIEIETLTAEVIADMPAGK